MLIRLIYHRICTSCILSSSKRKTLKSTVASNQGRVGRVGFTHNPIRKPVLSAMDPNPRISGQDKANAALYHQTPAHYVTIFTQASTLCTGRACKHGLVLQRDSLAAKCGPTTRSKRITHASPNAIKSCSNTVLYCRYILSVLSGEIWVVKLRKICHYPQSR